MTWNVIYMSSNTDYLFSKNQKPAYYSILHCMLSIELVTKTAISTPTCLWMQALFFYLVSTLPPSSLPSSLRICKIQLWSKQWFYFPEENSISRALV